MAATHLDMGLRCIKYLLCAVNSLFVLTGVMIISVGTTIYAVYYDFDRFLAPSYFSPATLLIVVGILVFIIAFFGCCGAIKESTCMVLVFSVSLSIVLVLEVAAAISAYALQDGIKNALADRINTTMNTYYSESDDTPAARASIDFMQSKLRCCGIDGPEDWREAIGAPVDPDEPYPQSCCAWTHLIMEGNGDRFCGAAYRVGCMERLSMIVHRSALNLGTGAIAIALIQFTGIMFACTLGRAIRRQKTDRERRRWELRESLVNGYQPLGKTDPQTAFPIVYMQPDQTLKTPVNC